MQTRITPNTDTFNAVLFGIISNSCFKRHIKVLENVTDQIFKKIVIIIIIKKKFNMTSKFLLTRLADTIRMLA